MNRLTTVLRSHAPAVTIPIRLSVGGVFLSEGIQMFLEPASRGVGRFAAIGIPWPEVALDQEVVSRTHVASGIAPPPA